VREQRKIKESEQQSAGCGAPSSDAIPSSPKCKRSKPSAQQKPTEPKSEAAKSDDEENEHDATVGLFMNNAKTTKPLSIVCSELLASSVVQDGLEFNKSAFEIQNYLYFMMAISIHLHGARWASRQPGEGALMIEMLDAWCSNLKVGGANKAFDGLNVVYFKEEENPILEDLFYVATSCMKAVEPVQSDALPKNMQYANGFSGKIENVHVKGNGDPEMDYKTTLNMVNNASNSPKYVFNEATNGIKAIIEQNYQVTAAHCKAMYDSKERGAHGNYTDRKAWEVYNQDRDYINRYAKVTHLKSIPAHLLNVDNLEATGSVLKQNSPIPYPTTSKKYLELTLLERMQSKGQKILHYSSASNVASEEETAGTEKRHSSRRGKDAKANSDKKK